MSGVYIKGMEMPKNCFECPWRCKVDPENLLCRISGEYFEETFSGTIQNRHKSCPLVPVPPHGRLIDADALIEDLERQCKEVFRIDAVSPDDYWIARNEAYNEALWKSWVESFGEYLKARLTIIPAEEGE